MAKKILKGTVGSTGMNKTVSVLIQRRIQHPLYKKFIKRSNKILADTNNIEISVGDVVEIEETRPISKNKSFKVIKKI